MMRGDMSAIIAPKGAGVKLFNATRHREWYSPRTKYGRIFLEVEQRKRTAGAYRLLASLTTEICWTAVRVRDLTRGGCKEQVRGYVRPFE